MPSGSLNRKKEVQMKKLFGIILTFTFLLSFITASFGESYVMHTVEEGDTYWRLSSSYGENEDNLLSLNNASDPTLIVGDFIKIRSLNKNIGISVNGNRLSPDSSPYLENSRTFVPIRFIAEALNVTIDWDGSNKTALITDGNNEIALPVGSTAAYVNGVSYNVDAPIKLYNDRIYIPIRFVSEFLNCTVEWNQSNYSVNITTAQNQNTTVSVSKVTYTEEDLYWLSRIVSAESSGEPYEGKLAVANVIINRMKSNEYPNTIKGVIFDKSFGVQFTPVKSGTIYNTPTTESIQAAKEALHGTNNIGNSLFFVNSDKTTLTWIQTSRTYYQTIDNHDFYL